MDETRDGQKEKTKQKSVVNRFHQGEGTIHPEPLGLRPGCISEELRVLDRRNVMIQNEWWREGGGGEGHREC